MKHLTFKNEGGNCKVALLIKESALKKPEMVKHYVEPLISLGVPENEIVAFSVSHNGSKMPAKLVKEYVPILLRALDGLGTDTIYCADATYFKSLTGMKKAESNYGYVLPCKWKGFEHISVILGTGYGSIFHNPANEPKLVRSLGTLASWLDGSYRVPGEDIIKEAYYPETLSEIKEFLDYMLEKPEITADFEAFSLKHYESGIATAGFAWDDGNGGAFLCDYRTLEEPLPVYSEKDPNKVVGMQYGVYAKNKRVRELLRNFFEEYTGTVIWHNISFDATIGIYNLWMDGILDRKGMLRGLDHMTKNWHCTKLISYLATNSCAGNNLSLKEQGQEFAGNYAEEEINNVARIPPDKLLEYNLVDCLTTWFTFNKRYPEMVADDQLDTYSGEGNGIFKDSLITIIEQQLTGMPVYMPRVKEVEKLLYARSQKQLSIIIDSPVVAEAIHDRVLKKVEKDNLTLKTKVRTYEEAAAHKDCKFNPGSSNQLAHLFHVIMGLPVIDLTKTKQPSCGADTIKKLIKHTANPEYLAILHALRAWAKDEKILSTFIPAFLRAVDGGDGMHYVFGNYNLGGTVSGRLSSSGPNMQNLPSKGELGKLIKSCFMAPDGWLFGGADFASLEDYISSLTTKDPNKLKVYTDGYDGHCLRAFSYFGKDMPDIIDTVESINSIKHKYPDFRDLSKVPTFLLTYGGTYHGLMGSLGLTKAMAQSIEANYHTLYAHSDNWVAEKVMRASKVGYITVAFGLRVRTPILAKTVLGISATPYEAQSEARTAGNALGQSYCLLNCRAANEFRRRVRESEFELDIKICSQIHDAIYLLWRDRMEVTQWVNDNLTECMTWQELPEIQHDTVKLHGELDVFYPHWGNGIELKPYDSQQTIMDKCHDGYEEYLAKAA